MNNFQKNKQFFIDNAINLLSDSSWGINKNNELFICNKWSCTTCKFHGNLYKPCTKWRRDWLLEEDSD